jgi:ABC-type multidrug transport system ATPase subunit
MAGVLELKQVSFSFAQHAKPFFDKICVSFPPGALHFVRGQNGAGKSTLFNILRGAVHAQEKIAGTIVVDGVVYNLDSDNRESLEKLQDDIKLVQQNFDLMLADQLTFEENLQVARMTMYPSLGALPEMQKLPTFVERFGIPKHKAVHLLSGGQRQMLAILMALQKPTKVLLLDEPTAALDVQNAKMIMEFLQALVEESGLTVLIISHDLELVQRYSRQRHYQISVDQETGIRSLNLVE